MTWENTEFIVFGAESGKIYVWDASTLTSLTVVQAHNGMARCYSNNYYAVALLLGAVTTVDVSVDGGALVTGGKDKTIAVWTITSCC